MQIGNSRIVQLARHLHDHGWSAPKSVAHARMTADFLNATDPTPKTSEWLTERTTSLAVEATRRAMTVDEFLVLMLDDVFAVYRAETDEDLQED
jgi:hypothetical protein